MKVLIFANDETTLLNFRQEIIKAFVKEQFEVFACYPFGENTSMIENLGCKTINIEVSRHGTSVIKDFKYMLNCKRIIREQNPDVVLTYTVKPNIYASIACQITKTPYINNVTGLGSVLENNGILAKLVLKLQKIGYRKSSCVFFQNEENMNSLRSVGVVNDKTTTVVIPGSGVNLEKQRYEEFPENNGIIRFVIVSRVREDKGYNEFFEAAKAIKTKYPNTEFHVVGWYEEEKFKTVIEELERDGTIIYHGKKSQEEVHEIEKRCNCLVHPSYHEGMANVILEAAATGRPVIATDIPGCREAFEEGITGFSFHPKDSNSLIEAMEKFVNISYEEQVEMGKLGRKKMEKEFDRQIVAKKYIEEIYKVSEEIGNGKV